MQYRDRSGCKNDNGIIDIGDVSSSVGRTSLQNQDQDVEEFRLDLDFAINDDMTLSGGAASAPPACRSVVS